jgi:hypothetical protein
MASEGNGLSLGLALAIGLGVSGIIYTAMHFGFSTWVGRRERDARKLMSRLDKSLSQAMSGQSLVQSAGAGATENAQRSAAARTVAESNPSAIPDPRIPLPDDEPAPDAGRFSGRDRDRQA